MNGPPETPVEHAHLGEGWAFPPRWERTGATSSEPGAPRVAVAVTAARGEVDVRQAIEIVLGTDLGSRVMRPTFGADVLAFVFAERRAETCFRLEAEVERALLLGEPRIDVQRVEAVPSDEDEARIDVLVDYTVDRHRRPESLVYPFHLQGAAPAPVPEAAR